MDSTPADDRRHVSLWASSQRTIHSATYTVTHARIHHARTCATVRLASIRYAVRLSITGGKARLHHLEHCVAAAVTAITMLCTLPTVHINIACVVPWAKTRLTDRSFATARLRVWNMLPLSCVSAFLAAQRMWSAAHATHKVCPSVCLSVCLHTRESRLNGSTNPNTFHTVR